jgi:hypothetical protein
MATVSPIEFRPTDIYQYVPFTPLVAGVALASSLSTGHIKVAVFQEPVRVLEMVVVTGAGAVVAGTSFRAAYGTQSTAVTADLANTLGAALAPPVVSSNNSLAIDTATTYGSVDTLLPPIVPAGSVIGINIVTPASSTVTVIGVYLRYRPA